MRTGALAGNCSADCLAVYVGDSASLAYLQLIRIIVQARTGTNNFTEDPSRHKILEATTETLPHFKPQILPDKETAYCLIDAFFSHVSGISPKQPVKR